MDTRLKPFTQGYRNEELKICLTIGESCNIINLR